MFEGKSKEVSKQGPSFITQDMTLDQVRMAILKLMAAENINQHRIGQLYNHVVDKKLAELAGFKNSQAYFRQNLRDMAQSTLTLYGAVARAFSEEIARRFGISCLYLLLGYKKAAGIVVDREQPGATVIEVPGPKGEVFSKPFSACTVEDMRKALQHKRQPPAGTPLTQEDVALVDQIDQQVMSRFVKGEPVRIQLRSHEDMAVLDFKGIPLAKLEQLKDALVAHFAAIQAQKVEPPATS
jgi:hypothetical protein